MYNGPGVISAAMKQQCDIPADKDLYDFETKRMADHTCADITFIPPQESGVVIRYGYIPTIEQ